MSRYKLPDVFYDEDTGRLFRSTKDGHYEIPNIKPIEIAGNYTVTNSVELIIITSDSAMTITIPDGLPVGSFVKIAKNVSGSTQGLISTSGSELIEGASSFVVYPTRAAGYFDPSIKGFMKVDSLNWKFVEGCIVYLSSSGMGRKYADGRLSQHGQLAAGTPTSSSPNVYGSTSGTTWFYEAVVTLPVAYPNTAFSVSGSSDYAFWAKHYLSASTITCMLAYGASFGGSGSTKSIKWGTEGSWR